MLWAPARTWPVTKSLGLIGHHLCKGQVTEYLLQQLGCVTQLLITKMTLLVSDRRLKGANGCKTFTLVFQRISHVLVSREERERKFLRDGPFPKC